MKDFAESPIIVTGCPRSGTSIISGMLELCGAFTGTVTKPTKHETRSMGENRRIYEDVVKPFLQTMRADPAGQWPLCDSNNLMIPIDWRDMVERVFKADGYTGGKWLYKSSNAAMLWRIWHFAYPTAKWIIVRRRTGDITSSCVQTAYMKAFKNPETCKEIGAETERDAWTYWVRKYEQTFVDMITEGLNCKVVWPERFLRGEYQQLYEIIDWVGLKWNPAVADYMDPKLWKYERKEE
jgi:hypothetical protein